MITSNGANDPENKTEIMRYKCRKHRYDGLTWFILNSIMCGLWIVTAVYTVTTEQGRIIAQEQIKVVAHEQKPNVQPTHKELTKTTVPNGSSGLPSQAQKDITAEVCKKVYDNRKDMIAKTGKSEGQFLSTCYYDLLAIARHESGFYNQAVGDNGKAIGPFQIHAVMHGITKEQAENYEFAAEWTLDRMVRDSNYPSDYTHVYSVQSHNGVVIVNGHLKKDYALAVLATSKKFKAMGL